MKIALTTIGSRGDIQPYIALGNALKNHGHQIKIVTHPWAKNILNAYELKHVPVGNDIDIHHVAKEFVKRSSNSMKGLKFALHFIFDQLKTCHKDLLLAIQDVDLIIGHGIVGQVEADISGKPFISVSIETMGLQKEYWKSKNIIKETGFYVADSLKGALFGGPYRKFRKDLNAPPANTTKKHPYLTLIPISRHLLKHNPRWKKNTRITGYFFADKPENYTPPSDLVDFISSGKKTVLITFGSMFHEKERALDLLKIIYAAVEESGTRTLLLMPDLNNEKIQFPDHLLLIKNTPYSWLLDKVDLVVHHFGFGTTAEVLKAGLPSIPIPHIFDQKIRAKQMYKLGLTHKPLNIHIMKSHHLSGAIKNAISDKSLTKKCADMGTKISNENGIEQAIKQIHEWFDI